jgi:peptidoglycan/xylan/chitin deacetylase (PgdA/CDA1 family)
MQRVELKRLIGQLYSLMRARAAFRKLILLYHSIGGGPEATATQTFRSHLKIIDVLGQLLPLPAIFSSVDSSRPTVAITFDDGYAALREHAAGILTDFGCTAMVFLNVNEIDERERRPSKPEEGYYPGERFLTWKDIDELLKAGWNVGSHGVRHLDLTRIDSGTARNEICASKLIIEQRTGTKCDMFAYPWGRNNAHVRAEVRSAGYRYGFSGDHSNLTSKSDLLALPRVNVAKQYSQDDLAAIIQGDWDYLRWIAKVKVGTW